MAGTSSLGPRRPRGPRVSSDPHDVLHRPNPRGASAGIFGWPPLDGNRNPLLADRETPTISPISGFVRRIKPPAGNMSREGPMGSSVSASDAIVCPHLGPSSLASEAPSRDFESIYEQHIDFVWQTVRRLGVPQSGLPDAVQEVFVIVHRRLESFDASRSVR